jgi:hypothetical protein
MCTADIVNKPLALQSLFLASWLELCMRYESLQLPVVVAHRCSHAPLLLVTSKLQARALLVVLLLLLQWVVLQVKLVHSQATNVLLLIAKSKVATLAVTVVVLAVQHIAQ